MLKPALNLLLLLMICARPPLSLRVEPRAGLAQGAITTTWETVFIVCAWGATEGHVTRGQYKDEQKESLNYVKTSM